MTAVAEVNASSAYRQLGERIGHLELGQAQIVGRLDGLTAQLTAACADMKAVDQKLDDHEVRIRLREQAYHEHILPALERLRNLELKVAGSAVIGGAVITGIVELVKWLAG